MTSFTLSGFHGRPFRPHHRSRDQSLHSARKFNWIFWLITLACTLVLLMLMDGAAARAEVVTEQSISMSGIVLIHPCTMEQLRLEGNKL